MCFDVYLFSSVFRFVLRQNISWNGLLTLKYSPVNQSVVENITHMDMVNISHDPRDTLALLLYPIIPVANLITFTGDTYHVMEDMEDAGFMVIRF